MELFKKKTQDTEWRTRTCAQSKLLELGIFLLHGLSVALPSVLSCYLSKCFLRAPRSSLEHVVELAPRYVHGVLFSHSLTTVN